MRALVLCVLVLFIIFSPGIAQIQDIDKYISEAEKSEKSGEIGNAVKVMEEAVAKYPDNSTINSYLGFYLGMQAGKTANFIEAGKLVSRAFEVLDKAVSLEPNNPVAHLHRGILGVSVPDFLGKMEVGIKDLEFLVELSQQAPDKVSRDMLVIAYNFLGQSYQKLKESQKAELSWKKLIELAPGTSMAENAQENLKKLSKTEQPKKAETEAIASLKQKADKEPNNSGVLLELGKAYAEAKDLEEAREILKKVIKMDPKNIEAYISLISVLGELAGKGYDEKIYENTDLRTNLAFEIVETIDKAVELAPENVELRLLRGTIGVQMPFFVGKLDQSMEDLNWVLKNNVTDSVKAEALYWLGAAHQKKAMTYWIKVVSDYPDSAASQSVFETVRPAVKHLDISKYKLPILSISFILGFRDELAPQTAVWVEDENGKFIKTIYVSGFSGHARESQINLPKWSESSKFSDVDGVTGASIDIGHHIYVWDLKDHGGKTVGPGKYTVKVEVAFWPSGQYQLTSVTINLGDKSERSVIEKGNLIPYLAVEYYH